MKLMRVSLLASLLILPVAAIQITGCSSKSQDAGIEAAAIVNGAVIPMEDLQTTLDGLIERYKAFGMQFDSTKVDSLRNQILETMISTELLYQESQKVGFEVSEDELSRELANIKSQYPSEEIFNEALAKQGLSEEKLRHQVSRSVAITNYIEENITNKTKVTPEEKAAYFEEHREEFKHDEQVGAKHILIQVDKDEPPDSIESKKNRIDDLLARINNGEDFSTLATEYSDCPSSVKGGDLGYFSRGKMVKPFEEAAFALKVGEVSGVVRTNYGYHIIKVYDRKGAGYSSFEEVEESIEQTLKRGQTSEKMEALLEKLKSKSDIKRMI
ncbi:MAG: peptidylprolyl isomerase [Candidatus Glassbacteria bacterium]